MSGVLAASFWTCVLLVAYTYVLYPAVIAAAAPLLARGRSKRPPGAAQDNFRPAVDVVIAAHDEEAHVTERLENVLEQHYPADRLRVLLGSDGSTDRTVELARAIGSDRIEVHDYTRRGKASVLNDLLAHARAPIVILSDANTMFAPDAVAHLVRPFADPEVGGVVGELRLLAASGDNQDSTYWRIERRLKAAESAMGGLLGANGAIYAIRRELFEPLPPDTIIDDFVIGMRISAAGHRLVYEPGAVAVEETPPDIGTEFRRRIRIGLGNYQAFFRYPGFLTRTSWGTRFTYLSHKVLRWFTPHLLVVAFVSSALLCDQPLYRVLFVAQLATYGFALAAFAIRRRIALPGAVRLPVFLLALNAAFAAGFWRYITGVKTGAWTRTAR